MATTIRPVRSIGLSSWDRRPSKGRDVTINDPQAVASRLRAATESLTDPQDVSLAQQYISELENLAAEQKAEDFKSEFQPLHRSFRHGRLRALRQSAPWFLLTRRH